MSADRPFTAPEWRQVHRDGGVPAKAATAFATLAVIVASAQPAPDALTCRAEALEGFADDVFLWSEALRTGNGQAATVRAALELDVVAADMDLASRILYVVSLKARNRVKEPLP